MKTDYEFKQFINELLDKASSINSCTVHKAWGTLYIGEVNGRSLSICFQTAVKNHVQRSMLSSDENLSILIEHDIKTADLLLIEEQLIKQLKTTTYNDSIWPFPYKAVNK